MAWFTAARIGSAWDTATTVCPGWTACNRSRDETIRACMARNDSPPGNANPLG